MRIKDSFNSRIKILIYLITDKIKSSVTVQLETPLAHIGVIHTLVKKKILIYIFIYTHQATSSIQLKTTLVHLIIILSSITL